MTSEVEPQTSRTPTRQGGAWKKIFVLALVLAALVVGYTQFGDALSFDKLAKQEAALRQFQHDHPILVYGTAFAVYVLVTGLSLPGAAVLTLLAGWYFGVLRGVIFVSFASTTGATLAFLLSRYLLRDWIQSRFGQRLKTFNDALDREGAFYLFTLRLIPVVPFFVINLVMGLTRVRVITFWWVSQIGMLAGTCVYVYAGSTIPGLEQIADPSQLRTNDIHDWKGLLSSLDGASKSEVRGAKRRVWELLPGETKELIREHRGSQLDLENAKKIEFINALNQLLTRPDLALSNAWQTEFSEREESRAVAKSKELTKVNRTLLVLSFPGEIGPPQPILSKQLILAFVLLGLFPIVVKRLMNKWRPSAVRRASQEVAAT